MLSRDGGAATEIEIEIAGASTRAGFKKPVGIVATPSAVLVADQSVRLRARMRARAPSGVANTRYSLGGLLA